MTTRHTVLPAMFPWHPCSPACSPENGRKSLCSCLLEEKKGDSFSRGVCAIALVQTLRSILTPSPPKNNHLQCQLIIFRQFVLHICWRRENAVAPNGPMAPLQLLSEKPLLDIKLKLDRSSRPPNLRILVMAIRDCRCSRTPLRRRQRLSGPMENAWTWATAVCSRRNQPGQASSVKQ